ncbi:oxysterol-binding protein 1 [Blumeria hordei DH14]|uniref:Oxysterol-binding protein 1 n=1 Tax=Blumeria graminis f. sp. hordei (strain DH14) TaxID=546991 RepID=N1JLW8_BLUG1|nr:oxysterol-binding protein 1 [Blumeria hordei DH14]
MVGLEQLEIHSKSYIVRWIRVEQGHTISWSFQPHKKSINFGIFKHPGTSVYPGLSAKPAPESSLTLSSQPEYDGEKQRRPPNSRNNTSTAQKQLETKGFKLMQWHGKCEADKVSIGTYDVLPGNGGMYGLIFDNTFSKQFSKTATLVLFTYPSNAPPQSNHGHLLNDTASLSSAGKARKGKQPSTVASASNSVDSLQNCAEMTRDTYQIHSRLNRSNTAKSTANHVGIMSKRRRKKGQGYAARYFSLDFATCTLSYYYNRNSYALRGAIPLSLAAISADKIRREFSIDSGAEIWHLKADSPKDFEEWAKALERASRIANGMKLDSTPSQRLRAQTRRQSLSFEEEEHEWEQVEALVSRIVGTRDAVRRLFNDTAPMAPTDPKQTVVVGSGLSTCSSSAPEDATDYFSSNQVHERKAFWKRKYSATSTAQLKNRSTSTQLMIPNPNVSNNTANEYLMPSPKLNTKYPRRREIIMHDHFSEFLNDLDTVLEDFSTLLSRSKHRRTASRSAQRSSIDSASTAEFFDAESGKSELSQVILIECRSDEQLQLSEEEFVTDTSSLSNDKDEEDLSYLNGAAALFPSKLKTFDPLPIKISVNRRKSIPPATVPPPSLISFLRKNVGKDLSMISMPVSANEPTSFLQRIAEQFEYAELLDKAISQRFSSTRLLYVAAFAISHFSINRCKERALRKPFNPMLGETYELLRTENEVPGGFRLIAEKVSHRPVRIACQADSLNWSISHSPAPTNKFWGKSAELITDGRVRLVLRLKDGSEELYSWTVANAFLRNVVMGEKYIEPVGSVTVTNESTGAHAVIEFKQKGIFGGRSEDVEAKAQNADRNEPSILIGNWTNSLRVIEAGKQASQEIWCVGELIDNPSQKYGLTSFAATLNEITSIEKDRLPITDSRLRPDQRAAEEGNLEEAERLKVILEERQRNRRRQLEERGEVWIPRWFVRAEGGDGGEEVWKLKSGKEGYWEQRSRGVWTGVMDVMSVSEHK